MKHIILLFACFYLAFSVNVSAQNVAGSVEVGPYVAYQFGFFSTDIPDIPGVNSQSSEVSTSGFSLGGLVAYHFTPTIAILGIIRYDYLDLYSKQMGAKDTYTDQNGEVQEYSLYASSRFKIPQLTTTLFCQYNVIGRLNLLGGAQIGILSNDTEENRYSLLFNPTSPMSFDDIPSKIPTTYKGQTPQYWDATHTSMVLYNGPIYQRNSMQIALAGGLSLETKLASNATITSYLFFTYNLSSYSQFEGIHGLTGCFGTSLKFTL